MTKGDGHKLNVFQHKCLRKILKVYWPMKISNEEIRERSGTTTIDEEVRTRRWKWLGHVLRMPSDKNPKTALTWAPEGRRRKGRPRETWRGTVNKEREHLGFRTWRQAEVAARDKVITVEFFLRALYSFHSTTIDSGMTIDSGVIFLDQSEFFNPHSNQ